MSSLSNFPTEKLMNVARLRNVDGNENISREQLENIFKTSLAPIPTPISMSRLRNITCNQNSTHPPSSPKCMSEPLQIDLDKLRNMEMAKSRPIPKNTSYQCYEFIKNYNKSFDEDSSKRFENTCQFYDGGVNKFCLILWLYL